MDDPKQGGEELHHKAEKPKSLLAAREEEVLAFWNREGIFQKSLEKQAPKGDFTFYDGPPFANGLPHYGHILASTIKDAIPRYRTMRGYRVPRRWGWDCHGLPVENLVERELGLKNKRDIEAYGIEKFNKAARVSIMKDVADWKRIIPRLGRWADMDHDYKTMDTSYTESVWWSFKNLFDRGLIYEGFKSLHYCPHCGTTLSNFEVAQGYKDIDDISVYVKLPLIDEPGTSLLVWTTTPWTLPGNAAAAVNADATYVKAKVGDEFLVVAKERAQAVLGDVEVAGEMKGKDLVGKKYLPPFDYFAEELHKHKTHAWKVYAAAYVTLDNGTGIVHIAPAFGAEDLELAQKEKIPLIHHVTDEGKFNAMVTDFAGLYVKPKGNPRETDEKVAALLGEHGLLFKQETVKHSYPHCWRCDTPLLNWAATSWFVAVSKVKGKLASENEKVSWVPEHIGKGRFKNGIESAPDWAISRSRYWGAPLPVWRNTKTKEVKVAGSISDLLGMVRRSGNRYFVMRHGEAQSNVRNMEDLSGDPENRLTDKGKNQAMHAAAELGKEKIDMIIASPFLRTHETAKIVLKELGLPDSALMTDERLREAGSSDETVRARVGEFIFEVERRYAGKNILFVSHGDPIWTLQQVAARAPRGEFMSDAMFRTGEVRELSFVPFPHNEDYELDLHRPYIDEVPMGNSMAGEWKRIPDVFDCWFESGSMPFASNHYPFKKDTFNPKGLLGFGTKGYPAQFIAEGLDQTRGWFYSLIVLGTALFNKAPYQNVIVNGMVLASDGQKMSKKLRNYPDPMEVVEKYGADSLRYYMLSSPVIRGEDLRFNERGVEEVQKKLLMRLDNVRSFYELYAGAAAPSADSAHVLDRWILSRLSQLIQESTEGFETYQLDDATRPLGAFIDDLSTWYLRRSRDRFKEEGIEKQEALATLRHVLITTAKVMAPVMPFFADDLYRRVREEESAQSVHLSEWPETQAADTLLVKDMELVRKFASRALQAREAEGVKLRQPLSAIDITEDLPDELQAVLMEEVNVKEVRVNSELGDALISLEFALTPELVEEGLVRDMVRRIQEWRKSQNLVISDRPSYELSVSEAEEAAANNNKKQLMEETGLSALTITRTDA
ncbi:MAG: Isoleucyl-tRNA synthetase, isoleucyl-tRNA synthetase [Candidatus Adlerbacteria bacterium]|nr:Isoleucyl-tRNA synthetase, isoleucyl-tRNA synthetase [Candidatus Adlerbacteria bacterium]